MKFVVKNFHSPDIYDLDIFVPDRPDYFSFLLEIAASVSDSEGEEIFSVVVCTPAYLIENQKPEDVVLGRAMLIVFEYNWLRIKQFVEQWIDQHCVGSTWREIANILNLISKSEYSKL